VFAIPLFQMYKICLAFYEMINFFSDDQILTVESKSIINLNNETLYWKGASLYNLTVIEKKIQICIESENSDFKFDVLFSNFQNFVIAIEKAIRGAFCFKFEDALFLNYILKEPLQIILSYVDEFQAIKCIKQFNEKFSEQYCLNFKIEFLQYYLEIIVVLKKVNLMIMEKYPRKDILKILV
jgi:hypothetical protein